MNTEQFKREKLAGEYLNQYSIDGGSDYAASIFNAFCVGYTIAETPLLERIAELEKENANLIYGVECMQKVLIYVGDCAGVSHGNVGGLIDWADKNRITQ